MLIWARPGCFATLPTASLGGALAAARARRLGIQLQHARMRAQFAWLHLSPLLVQFSG